MALWNEKSMPGSAGPVASPSAPPERSLPERTTSDPALAGSPRRPTPKTSSEGGESVIAAKAPDGLALSGHKVKGGMRTDDVPEPFQLFVDRVLAERRLK